MRTTKLKSMFPNSFSKAEDDNAHCIVIGEVCQFWFWKKKEI